MPRQTPPLLLGAAAAALTASLGLAGPDGDAEPSGLPAPLADADFAGAAAPGEPLFELGRLLFFDPVLSGNRNVSCGACHDPRLGTSDGLALGLGEGAHGAGPERRAREGVTARAPRNAPALWNLDHREVRALFHDGRLEIDEEGTFPSGFWSPAREDLPKGLDSLLAAQAMLPALSPVEMAGRKGENPLATAVAEDRRADAWALLATRLAANPAYADMFEAAFEEVGAPADIGFVHAARALAAFQAGAFRSHASPFDAVLAGEREALSPRAREGMALFYGEAGCAGCHSGSLLSDGAFHAIAVPQIGPGLGHGADTSYWGASGFSDRTEDEGRFRVTFEPADLFRFRTPSLRNVELTAPYGHSGAYATLEGVVRHHLDPAGALHAYGPERARAALAPVDGVIEAASEGSALIFRPLNPARRADWEARDGWVQGSDLLRGRVAEAAEIAPRALGEPEVEALVAFLGALTDPTARDRSHLIPVSVPSGLPPQPAPDPHAASGSRTADDLQAASGSRDGAE